MRNKGFTLIELLVVVLIIGILAAIALPQYKLAVAKSRVSTMYALGKSLANAERIYYLANNTYTKEIQNLDIDLPDTCSQLTEIEDEQHTWYSCRTYFTLDNDQRGAIRLNYCPGFNTGIELCEGKRILQINFYFNKDYKNIVAECEVENSSKFGEKICSNIGTYYTTTRYRL